MIKVTQCVVIIVSAVLFVVYLKGRIIIITFLQSYIIILIVNILFIAASIKISITAGHEMTKASIPK